MTAPILAHLQKHGPVAMVVPLRGATGYQDGGNQIIEDGYTTGTETTITLKSEPEHPDEPQQAEVDVLVASFTPARVGPFVIVTTLHDNEKHALREGECVWLSVPEGSDIHIAFRE